MAARSLDDLAQQRIPGHGGGDIRGGVGGDNIGIRGVDDCDILLGEALGFQCPGQQVVGDAQLHQIDLLPLQIAQGTASLENNTVVAIGEVADDQRRGVNATGRRYGQGIHIGHHAAIEATGRVLVDRLDIVIDLHHLDVDVILIRPLFDDAALGGIVPGHPAGVDGPGDLEFGFVLGMSLGADEQQRDQQHSHGQARQQTAEQGDGDGIVHGFPPWEHIG